MGPWRLGAWDKIGTEVLCVIVIVVTFVTRQPV